MGKYDNLRNAVSGSSSAAPSTGSKYDSLRMSMGLIPDTRPKPEKSVTSEGPEEQVNSRVNGPVELDDVTGNLDKNARMMNENTQRAQAAREIPVIGHALKTLDWISEKTNPVAKVMRDFYVPGAGLANITGLTNAAEAGIAKALPKLGNSALGRIGQKAASEAIAGVPLGVAQEQMTNPDANGMDYLKGAAFGAGGGAVLGGLGKGIGEAIKYGKDSANSLARNAILSNAERETLSLPVGRGDARYNEALNRSNLSPGNDPIVNPYTFKLPEASETTITHKNNMDDAFNSMREIDDQVNSLDSQYKQAVNDQYKLLKEQRDNRGGVDQGYLLKDEEGYVHGQVGRMSNNPQWYQDFYAQYGKVPSNKDLYKLAQKHVDEGYIDNGVNIPAWAKENDYHGTKEALGSVREEIRNSIKENGLNITDAQLKDNVLKSMNKPVKLGETPLKSNKAKAAPIEDPNIREYGTLTSLKNSPKVNPETVASISQKGDTTYEVKHNQTTVDNANSKLNELGNDGAKSYLLNKDNKGILSSDDVALGYRLIDEYQANGDYDSAADVALKLMQSNLEGGRSIQINSIYNRLTPEGALRVATREFNKNAKTAAEQKSLPADVAEKISGAAKKLREATGNNEIAKDAMTVLEKAKSGEKLTDDELSKLKKFFDEAKKYVGEDKPERVRKRDGVAKYSANQAAAARRRLASSRNLHFAAQSGNPLVDYAIIGADHMVQGAVKFADFAEKMVKEFGNNYDMDELYIKSWDRYKRLNKLKSSEFENMVGRAMSGRNMSDSEKLAMRRMAIELSQLTGNAQKEAMAEMQSAFNAISESSTGKKAASLLRSAQLGNARTVIRNEVSNNLFYALDTIRRKFAVIPDILTPGERTVFVKNNLNAWNQYFKDWKTGYRYGKQGINPKGLESQYDLGGLAFNPTSTKITDRIGSFLERQVGAVMKAGDYASANRAISTELYQLAQAKAYKEGLRGKAFKEKSEFYFHNADEKMEAEALKYGEYMTFQDKNFASTAAVALRDKVLNLGKDFGLGNIVFNYPKTPTNILMRAIDYSPAGYLRFMTQVGKAAFKKDVTKRELIDSFTRATAGSAMAGIGMYLANIGVLNVLPSKDSAMNTLERSAGKFPNSLNVTALTRYVTSFGDREAAKPQQGDYYASVDWLQPMAITSSVGASFSQAQSSSRLKTGAGAAEVAVQSLDAAAESAGNMSVYRTFKDLVGSQYQGAGEKFGKLASNAATAFIPSLSGQLRNAIDPNTRDTKDKNVLKQIGKSILNKTPGASLLLNERYDNLGNELKSDFGPIGRTINSFVNPSIMDKYNPSEGAQIVLDLIDRTGETRLAPNAPSKTFTYKKETYAYTPDEYRELQKEVGKLVQEGLDKNSLYLKGVSSDQKKMERIDKIMTDALEKAKKEYRREQGIR